MLCVFSPKLMRSDLFLMKKCLIYPRNVFRNTNSIISLYRFCSEDIMSHRSYFYKNKKGLDSSLRHIKNQQKVSCKIGHDRSLGFNKHGSAVLEIHVIGTGYPGTPRSIAVKTSLSRYLFNCGGGTQRIGLSTKLKIGRTSDVFFTQPSWNNLSGFLGMCLTLNNADVPVIRVHGQTGVTDLVTDARHFGVISKMKIVPQDLSQGSFTSNDMNIEYIILNPKESEQTGSPAAKRMRLSSEHLCVAYLLKPTPKSRKVDVEKCATELGITKGAVIGQLVSGQSVTLDDGRTVNPEDILVPEIPNKPIFVLECPSMDHLDSLLKHSSVEKMTSSSNPEDSPCVICHMTPDHILSHPNYLAWMNTFPADTMHMIVNEKCPGIAMEGVHKIQVYLNMIHQKIFPKLPLPAQIQSAVPAAANIVHGVPLMSYIIRGTAGTENTIDREQCVTINEESYRKLLFENDTAVEGELEKLSAVLKKQENKCEEPYPEVLFLGTGSAEPNKTRNVSAIWLQISEDICMLLDCGEDTLGQIIRYFGDRADDMILKLHVVFISHLHADHHLGLSSIAKYRQGLLKSRGVYHAPLLVIAPKPLQNWFKLITEVTNDIQESLISVVPIPTFYAKSRNRESIYEEVMELLDMSLIETVFVKHSAHPHGVVLVHNSGWKLVYSGDTEPCEELIQAGKDCDLLIHEASMEDELVEDARHKRHSTTSEAIQVGLDMGAKFILLTHFSQRYSRIPMFNENFSDRVGIAFDNMRVSLGELHLLPLLLPALKQTFSKHYMIMEKKQQQRTWAEEASTSGSNKKKKKRQKRGDWTQTSEQT